MSSNINFGRLNDPGNSSRVFRMTPRPAIIIPIGNLYLLNKKYITSVEIIDLVLMLLMLLKVVLIIFSFLISKFGFAKTEILFHVSFLEKVVLRFIPTLNTWCRYNKYYVL
uniref:Uncharacterized protein n=1 Tax=Cacopsylla melanoneura TaxID=428564 RepID=A0A8D8TK16_9HEMI